MGRRANESEERSGGMDTWLNRSCVTDWGLGGWSLVGHYGQGWIIWALGMAVDMGGVVGL